MLSPTPLEIGDVPQLIAWWVGYFGMLLGAYVIFVCERRDLPLLVYGAMNALLGVTIFATVRFPDWIPAGVTRPVLISVTLLLIFGLVVHLTYYVWDYYSLKPPWIRILEVTRKVLDWLRARSLTLTLFLSP